MAKSLCLLLFSLSGCVISQRACQIKDKTEADKCETTDPCKRFNTRDIPFLDSRHPSVRYSAKMQDVNKFCDLYALDDGIWYISDYNITQTCVQQESCGSRLPIWLNGTVPSPADGAVNSSACVRTYDGCCAKSYMLMVKNCIYYNVYCFWELPDGCPQRFCFDVDLSKVTTTTTTTTTTSSAVSKGTSVGSSKQGNQKDDQSDRGVIIGLTSVVVLSVTAIVVLSGLIVVLKKKLSTSVIPNTEKGGKVVLY